MRLIYGSTFDSGVWPGPLGSRDTALGEAWVGPAGLVSILETRLGLGGRVATDAERAIHLVARLHDTEGFWSRSAEVDVFATARTLLHWRDALVSHGWRPESVGEGDDRLSQLATLTRTVPDGLFDRMRACAGAMAGRSIGLESVDIVGERPEELPSLIQTVLRGLAGACVRVHHRPVVPVEGLTGDLGAIRDRHFRVERDGSVQLLRPYGVMNGAEMVAAWLATFPKLEGVVIISPDSGLDTALRRYGLPVTGHHGRDDIPAALQVLPLVLQLGWSHQDPEIARQLLLLPRSPIPGKLRGLLLDALGQWPALHSNDWSKAIKDWAESAEDPQRIEGARERVERIFEPGDDEGSCTRESIDRRVDAVVRWALGVQSMDERPDAGLDRLISASNAVRRFAEASQMSSFTRAELWHLIDAAVASAGVVALTEPEAGVHTVGSPASIVGPASVVVWWNYTRGAAERLPRVPFTTEERAALTDAGVTLPELAGAAARLSRQWRRPMEQARRALMLVCPACDEGGLAVHPHPAWDEIVSRGGDQQAARLQCDEPIGVEREHALELLPPPATPDRWRIDGGIDIPEDMHLSPTSGGSLIGSPLCWVVERLGRVRRGRTSALPSGPLPLGNLAHEIIESVVDAWCAKRIETEAQGRALAETLYQEVGPARVAPLFAPGNQVDRERVRHHIVETSALMVRAILKGGFSGAEIERKLTGTIDGIPMVGYADLILSDPAAIIDIKWSGAGYRRKELNEGTAYQLAVYAALAGGDAPAAYCIVRDAQFVAPPGTPFDGMMTDGPSLSRTLEAFIAAVKARLEEIRGGLVVAVDQGGVPESAAVIDGRLVLPPSPFGEVRLLFGEGVWA